MVGPLTRIIRGPGKYPSIPYQLDLGMKETFMPYVRSPFISAKGLFFCTAAWVGIYYYYWSGLTQEDFRKSLNPDYARYYVKDKEWLETHPIKE